MAGFFPLTDCHFEPFQGDGIEQRVLRAYVAPILPQLFLLPTSCIGTFVRIVEVIVIHFIVIRNRILFCSFMDLTNAPIRYERKSDGEVKMLS